MRKKPKTRKRLLISGKDLNKVLRANLWKKLTLPENPRENHFEIKVSTPHFQGPIYTIIPKNNNEAALKVHFSKPKKLSEALYWILKLEEADQKTIKHCVQTSQVMSNQIIKPLTEYIKQVAQKTTIYLAFDTNTYTVLKNIPIIKELARIGTKKVRYLALRPVKAELTTRKMPIFGNRYLKELKRLWELDRKTVRMFKGAPLLTPRKWLLARSAYDYALKQNNTIEIGEPYKGDAEIISTLRKLKKRKPSVKIILATFDRHIPEDTHFEKFTLYYPSTIQLKNTINTTLKDITDLLHVTAIIFQTITLENKKTKTKITLTKHWNKQKKINTLKKDKLIVEITQKIKAAKNGKQ